MVWTWCKLMLYRLDGLVVGVRVLRLVWWVHIHEIYWLRVLRPSHGQEPLLLIRHILPLKELDESSIRRRLLAMDWSRGHRRYRPRLRCWLDMRHWLCRVHRNWLDVRHWLRLVHGMGSVVGCMMAVTLSTEKEGLAVFAVDEWSHSW